jgi:hypothetical protein
MAATSLETTKTIRPHSVSSEQTDAGEGAIVAKPDDLEPAVVFVAWQVAMTEPKHRGKLDPGQTSDASMLPFVWLG